MSRPTDKELVDAFAKQTWPEKAQISRWDDEWSLGIIDAELKVMSHVRFEDPLPDAPQAVLIRIATRGIQPHQGGPRTAAQARAYLREGLRNRTRDEVRDAQTRARNEKNAATQQERQGPPPNAEDRIVEATSPTARRWAERAREQLDTVLVAEIAATKSVRAAETLRTRLAEKLEIVLRMRTQDDVAAATSVAAGTLGKAQQRALEEVRAEALDRFARALRGAFLVRAARLPAYRDPVRQRLIDARRHAVVLVERAAFELDVADALLGPNAGSEKTRRAALWRAQLAAAEDLAGELIDALGTEVEWSGVDPWTPEQINPPCWLRMLAHMKSQRSAPAQTKASPPAKGGDA